MKRFVLSWCITLVWLLLFNGPSAIEARARAHDLDRLDPGASGFMSGTTTEQRRAVWAQAVVCISEADFNRSRDCAAIAQRHHGIAERTGRPLLDVIREGSPLATDYCSDPAGARLHRCRLAGTRPRQEWVSTLRLDAQEPAGWPEMNRARIARGLLRLPWDDNRRERWLDVLRDAERFVDAKPRVCREDPDTWGGACTPDGRPASRTGVCDSPNPAWVQIDCGPICPRGHVGPECTVNAFYRIPRIRRPSSNRGTIIPASIARGRRGAS